MRLFPLLVLIASLVPTNATAQAADSNRIGIGVSISNAGELIFAGGESALTPSVVSSILVPIDIGRRLRVEPEIGAQRVSSTSSQTFGGSSSPESKFTSTLLNVGVGAFGRATHDRATAYYGGRFNYLHYSRTSEVNTSPVAPEPNFPGWLVAPTIGGEYLLGDQFSLGAEMQVRFIWWSNESSVTLPGGSTSSNKSSGTSIATRAAVTARFYFSR